MNANADELERQILILHRDEGHLRCTLPAPLLAPAASAALERALLTVTGVHRASVLHAQGKLSVYFDQHACTARDVGLCLRAFLHEPLPAEMPAPVVETRSAPATGDLLEQLRTAANKWGGALGAMAGFTGPGKADDAAVKNLLTERSVINFLNDVTVFYLIKVHWDLITKLWIRDPVKYRYAWLTVFYLVYLLVRFRKQAVAEKPPAK
jgi:hypothetical protein